MKRWMRCRQVLFGGAGAALCLASVPALSQAQTTLTVAPVAPSIHVIHGHPGGNVLVVTGTDGTILVDAQSAGVRDSLRAALVSLRATPVRIVVSTHYHEDHIGGNDVFASEGADIVGHVRLRVQALIDTTITELEWHREAAAPDDLPTLEVEHDTTLTLGDVSLRLTPLAAHTDGDLAVFFPESNVLHTGDILEVDAFPFIDWWAGGSLRGIVDALDRLLEMIDGETRIVPGHGRVVNRAHLEAYREMLVTVGGRVRGAIQRGESLEAVMDAGFAGEFAAARGGEPAARRFVGILYLGLRTP